MIDTKDIKSYIQKFKPQCSVCKKQLYPDDSEAVIYIKAKGGKINLVHKKCFRSGK